ncbi:MAG: InlB B-repeat-containing protein, partial [Mogibacterium sp.]|nr:InlB B-repeat-containing protein [Mogibacterium sp.]
DGWYKGTTKISDDLQLSAADARTNLNKETNGLYKATTYTAHFDVDENGNGVPDKYDEFKIVYDLDGGSTTSAQTEFTGLKVGDKTPTIAAPTKDGYVFAGWQPTIKEKVDAGDAASSTDKLTITYKAIYTVAPAPPVTPPTGGGGNGGGGGGPTVTPDGPVPPNVIPDEPIPTVDPPVDIVDPAPPLAEGTWALINLISAIVTALGAVIALFRKKEDEDEDEDNMYKEEDEDDNRGKKMLAAKIAGALAGVAAPITFFLTEDMSLPMAMIDKWTVLMVAMLAVQVVAAVFNKKAAETEDDQETAEEAAN